MNRITLLFHQARNSVEEGMHVPIKSTAKQSWKKKVSCASNFISSNVS
jgi:hypothetical protein